MTFKTIAIILLAVLIVATVFFCAEFRFVFLYKSARLPENFTVTAHTGSSGTEDNTLDSIISAAENGADVTEFDLNFTADGLAVLSHDTPVGEAVTLEEAFLKLAEYPELKANVDVKTTTNLTSVQTLAEKHGVLDRIFYTGVDENFVEAAKNDSPKIPYYLNMSVRKPVYHTEEYILSLVEKVQTAGAVGINFHYSNCSKKLVKIFRENGLLVSLWTANDTLAMKYCLYCEPDNITTRHPENLRNLIEKLN